MSKATIRPRGLYYGWVLVVSLALTETTSYGVLYYSFSVFLKPMQDELGWSRAALTGALSLALMLSGAFGLLVGRWLDRHGPRGLMTAGSCLAVFLVLAWSRVQSLVALYLIWAGVGVVMAAVLYEPAFWVVAAWFRRRRGRALTVLTFIAGFASVVYIPLAGFLVHGEGWRGALVILAGLLAVGTVPLHALVLRRRPEDLGLSPDGAGAPAERATDRPSAEKGVTPRAAFRGFAFWGLAFAFFLISLGSSALTVHFVALLTDRGYGLTFAAAMAGAVGLMGLPGRLIFTPLGDRIPRGLVTAVIFLTQALAFVVLLSVRGEGGVVAFIVLFGAGFGAITPARAGLVADYYGRLHYGSINSVIALFVTLGRALGPLGMGILYDATRGYGPALDLLTILAVIGAVTILVADLRARREIPR